MPISPECKHCGDPTNCPVQKFINNRVDSEDRVAVDSPGIWKFIGGDSKARKMREQDAGRMVRINYPSCVEYGNPDSVSDCAEPKCPGTKDCPIAARIQTFSEIHDDIGKRVKAWSREEENEYGREVGNNISRAKDDWPKCSLY